MLKHKYFKILIYHQIFSSIILPNIWVVLEIEAKKHFSLFKYHFLIFNFYLG